MKIPHFCVLCGLIPIFFGSPASACDTSKVVLGIDVGHTIARPGATSARGVAEFTFNLALARVVRDTIVDGHRYRAFLINEDGKIGGLPERPAAALAGDATLFLSIHHDAVQNKYLETWTFNNKKRYFSDKFSGFSVFTSANNPEYEASLRFGRAIGQALVERKFHPTLHHAEPIPGENRPLVDPELGLYHYDGLRVLRHAKIPAVLLEAGIIVNRDDETALLKPETRHQIADAILEALDNYCHGAVDRQGNPPEPSRTVIGGGKVSHGSVGMIPARAA